MGKWNEIEIMLLYIYLCKNLMNGEEKICLYKISFFIYRLYIGIIIYFKIVYVYK